MQPQWQGLQRRKVEDLLVTLNKEVVRQLFEDVYSKGDLYALERLLATTVRALESALPSPVEGIAPYRANVERYRRAFPDLKFRVVDLVAEGERVAARWLASGTHQGELMGMPPTGRFVSDVSGSSVFRLSGGKIVDEQSTWDVAGLLRQLEAGTQKLSETVIQAELKALKARFAEFGDAFNRQDLAGIAAFFADTATVISPIGKFATGRDGIRGVLNEDLASIMVGSTSTFTVNRVRLLGPNLAGLDAVHEIAGPNVPGGKVQLHVFGIAIKENGRWLWLDARPHSYLSRP
jgi:steroid delta-isomerase-like uncharacterized protein/uncharacterized protein (TIGR02246 family)